MLHILHSVTVAETEYPDDFGERIDIAMKDMGVSVFKGGFTTFIGMLTYVLFCVCVCVLRAYTHARTRVCMCLSLCNV